MPQEVVQYILAAHLVQKQFQIDVRFKNGSSARWPMASAEEFSAVAEILREGATVREDGWVFTGPEAPEL
jgi:hypothetical protein